MAKIRNLDAGFRVKNFSYTYSLFKGNHSMESKIIEYRIILLYKYKVEQTEVISRLLFTFFTHKLQERLVRYRREHLHFPNTF